MSTGKINKLGFGFLRLPDKETVSAMVDEYMALGGIWFDTCYTYMDGESEEAIRECVVRRKPAGSYKLIEKLPGYMCKSYDDCQKYFDEELQRCGVEYFDVFMLHWLNEKHYAIAEKYDEFRFLREKKAEGRAGRIGFSYHGTADLLDTILTEHPETDVVLLQINYLDWEASGIESGKCYETALKHGVSVFVMEPVKGGSLASLPEEAADVLKNVHPNWTQASWALRFAQSLGGVELVLSGMNEIPQIAQNMEPFVPLGDVEKEALAKVCGIIERNNEIPCTGCRYCTDHCPMGINIPRHFRTYNEVRRYPEEEWKVSYEGIEACISCGSCMEHCPQNINIPEEIRRMTG